MSSRDGGGKGSKGRVSVSLRGRTSSQRIPRRPHYERGATGGLGPTHRERDGLAKVPQRASIWGSARPYKHPVSRRKGTNPEPDGTGLGGLCGIEKRPLNRPPTPALTSFNWRGPTSDGAPRVALAGGFGGGIGSSPTVAPALFQTLCQKGETRSGNPVFQLLSFRPPKIPPPR